MPAALIFALALQSAALQSGAAPQLADLRQAYEQSCLQRDYGSFDDVCNQLSDQIAAYARAHREAPAASEVRDAGPPRAPPAPPPPPALAPGAVDATANTAR